jgi:magnesium transporter
VRITDSLDTYRDLLSSALDAYLSVVSTYLPENSIRMAESANRLNQTMQTLTAWSIILMGCSLIAGIYGMNFRDMPELTWQAGYPLALGLMAAASGILYVVFRKKDWL